MTVNNYEIYGRAYDILKQVYGENARFREGQYEAIEATMTRKRSLIVQKTGWGKSLVYFMCTKLLRESGKGVTMVVSPLLALMKNQIEAARKIGLKCDVLNGTVKDRKQEILDALEKDELDLVLITPETLFNDEVKERRKNIKIGLFVVDEAHCISDWGHDFRLNYGNLKKVVQTLPQNVPILATTATANNRVVADLEKQLGEDVYISRGPLMRKSLAIQVLKMPTRMERYAWILQNINQLQGSGIIYCLTRDDCEYISHFLQQNGILAEPYYSKDGEEDKLITAQVEERFMNNQIKVIVATVKLGMGYDKRDISFVIHFQMPSNIVSYYQQIGRAGRGIAQANTFLMCGQEDEDIINYFINTAFPKKTETEEIMNYIINNEGAKQREIESHLNIKQKRIEKALSFLQHDGFIRKDKSVYYATAMKFYYDSEHYDQITATRIFEMTQMKELTKTSQCYNRFVVNCLDDDTTDNCGVCSNCLGKEIISSEINQEYLDKAAHYLNSLIMKIEPRKIWAYIGDENFNWKKIEHINETGICLCKYGDPGYGSIVKNEKYGRNKHFSDELVKKSVEVLKSFVKENEITHVCCVPSNRTDIVKDFSERLAKDLKLEFCELLLKTGTRQQKEMENSSYQCYNAYKSFSPRDTIQAPKRVLLVDDVVDSRWTLTVCGYNLMKLGCEKVYPYALANSNQREG